MIALDPLLLLPFPARPPPVLLTIQQMDKEKQEEAETLAAAKGERSAAAKEVSEP